MRSDNRKATATEAGRTSSFTFTQRARRAQIVQAAIETLAESGYTRTTFSRISRQARLCSTGMISYHFSGKPELITEVAHTIMGKAETMLEPRLREVDTYRGKLGVFIGSTFEFASTYPTHTLALVEIVAMARDRGSTGLERVEQDILCVERLAALLEHGVRAGEFGAFDCRTMAFALRGAIDGVLCQYLRHEAVDLDRCAQELTRAFGLCAQAA
ncbi:TetR/AcrR family transcriptional regulator [Streptomyces longwoodensis]|uniref:TetR/AcrR family transcriptional regulator n=1 Tax=Streptomyces longwoodensis TaxID=68231 RepID=UPI0032539B69